MLDIQTELQERGYYQGRLDGLTGPNTRGAIQAFQRDAGLVVTGNVGSGLLNELRAADPSIRRYCSNRPRGPLPPFAMVAATGLP